METITSPQVIASSHTIPLDVFIDVVRILLGNSIQWEVEGVNEIENSLLIQARVQPHLLQHRKAMDNIRSILSDYGYFLKESPNGNGEVDNEQFFTERPEEN